MDIASLRTAQKRALVLQVLPALKPFFQVIRETESAQEGYDAHNGFPWPDGTTAKEYYTEQFGAPVSQLSLAQARTAAKRVWMDHRGTCLEWGTGRHSNTCQHWSGRVKSTAHGFGQFIRATQAWAADELGLLDSTPFSPKVQQALVTIILLVKRPEVAKLLLGQDFLRRNVQRELFQEWEALRDGSKNRRAEEALLLARREIQRADEPILAALSRPRNPDQQMSEASRRTIAAVPHPRFSVRDLQRRLNIDFGFDVKVDGLIGPKTSGALYIAQGTSLGAALTSAGGLPRLRQVVQEFWTAAEIRLLQRWLTKQGFKPGPIDGRMGQLTYSGILRALGSGRRPVLLSATQIARLREAGELVT